MSAVFVVKAVDDDGQPIPGVFDELKVGRARIGWSYQDNLDLNLIHKKIKQGKVLDEDERNAKRCLGFLTDLPFRNAFCRMSAHRRTDCVRFRAEYNPRK